MFVKIIMYNFKVCTEKGRALHSLRVEYVGWVSSNSWAKKWGFTIFPLTKCIAVLKTLCIYDLIWTLSGTGFLVKQNNLDCLQLKHLKMY